MKKSKIRSLQLNKKAISNFQINGGGNRQPRSIDTSCYMSCANYSEWMCAPTYAGRICTIK